MRFDQATVEFTPRTVPQCLDLALLLIRREFPTIARIWLTFAVPVCVLVWYFVDRHEYDLRFVAVVVLLATSPLGTLLVAAAAPHAFGEPCSYWAAWRRALWKPILIALAWRVVIGLAGLLLVFPGALIAVRKGFLVERLMLSRLAGHLEDRRTRDLIGQEFSDLFVRAVFMCMYCALVAVVLFVTIDMGSAMALQFPILIQRLQVDAEYTPDDEGTRYLAAFLWNDPRVMTVLAAVALMVYVIGRLAWFFVYIDLRVRRDLWDVELRILQEVQLLESSE